MCVITGHTGPASAVSAKGPLERPGGTTGARATTSGCHELPMRTGCFFREKPLPWRDYQLLGLRLLEAQALTNAVCLDTELEAPHIVVQSSVGESHVN